MSTIPVVTIDGPSGSGKGTIAARVAEQLGFHLLDSGALYRLLGLAVQQEDIDVEDVEAIVDLAESLDIEFGADELVLLAGEDVSLDIRTDSASEMASKMGAIPEAREALHQRQLDFRQTPGLVADGRDMGTLVFPDANLKIFLTASLEERANRRHKQLIAKGIGAILPALLQELKERDERDSQRQISPLRPAADAHIIDTSEMSIDETLQEVLRLHHESS